MKASRRVAWSLWAVAVALDGLCVALFLLGRGTRLPGVGFDLAQSIPFIAGIATIGALVASRQARNPIGWLLLYLALVLGIDECAQYYAVLSFLHLHRTLPGARWAAWAQLWLQPAFFPIPFAIMLMLVPDGRFLSSRWRRVGWIVLTANALGVLAVALTPGPLVTQCCSQFLHTTNPVGVSFLPAATKAPGSGGFANPALGVVTVVGIVVMLPGALASLWIRRRRGTAEVRSQLGLVALVIAVAAAIFFFAAVSMPLVSGDVTYALVNVAIIVLWVGVPAATGIGMLRYRLFDLDLVVRRTVLYGTTAVMLVLLYLVVAVAVGAIAGRSEAGAVTAAAVIGLSFVPATRLARRAADRFVYGKRATPFEVLSQFSERVAGSYAADEVLPRIARLLYKATGATSAAVWLRVGQELHEAAAWPETSEARADIPVRGEELPELSGVSHADPVRDGDELLGALTVTKPSNDPVGTGEIRLMSHLASQSALVLRNVRLVEELRASRQRLVTAQDAERRRLERNLHDGAQQQLVALAVKLRLALQLGTKDPAKGAELLQQAAQETTEALDTLRDLARGIYPPLLADQGLAVALEAQGRKNPIPIAVEADGLGRYPQEVEAAVYFCCLESLQNAAKYAQATKAVIRLGVADGTLGLKVHDDGRGFDPATTPPGSGLTNMRDRVESLGGTVHIRSAPGEGTAVSAKIPIGPTTSPQPSQ